MDFSTQFEKLRKKNISSFITSMVLRDPIHCKDGSTFSIQASGTHYCHPQNSEGPYTHYEVGYPENEAGKPIHEPLLQEYGDYPVYGYVPENVVIEVLLSHGGIQPID